MVHNNTRILKAKKKKNTGIHLQIIRPTCTPFKGKTGTKELKRSVSSSTLVGSNRRRLCNLDWVITQTLKNIRMYVYVKTHMNKPSHHTNLKT